MDFDELYKLQSIPQEEFDQVREGILAMGKEATNTLDDIARKRLQEVDAARQMNWNVYELILNETAILLHVPLRLVQDALTMQCIERGERPFEALSLVHDFLKTLADWQQHEVQPEQPAETPYFGRQE